MTIYAISKHSIMNANAAVAAKFSDILNDITKHELFQESQTLGGGAVLPGLLIPLRELFGELDRSKPMPI